MNIQWPFAEYSKASIAVILTNPRKPWSLFLNLRWSKIWIVIVDVRLIVLGVKGEGSG